MNEMAIPNNKYNPKILLMILQSIPPGKNSNHTQGF
jgi:hypothetical protein